MASKVMLDWLCMNLVLTRFYVFSLMGFSGRCLESCLLPW